MKHRKNTGCGCMTLILLILALGVFRLWTHFDIPAQGAYGEADRIIAAFAQEHGLSLSDYPEELRALLERNPETEDFVLH